MNSNNNQVTARVVSVGELKDTEIHKWNELCSSDVILPSAFLSFHFAQAVSAVHPGVRVCVLEHNESPVGFLPFQHRNSLARYLGSAERVGEHLSDYFGLVAENNFRISAQQLLTHANLSHLIFTHLDESQKQLGLDGDKTTMGVCYDVSEGVDSYWEGIKQRDKKFHAHTLRQVRRIEREMGPLRLEFDVRDDGSSLQSLIEQKRSQYASTNAKDALAEQWCQNLLFRLYDLQEPTCRGVLSALYAGDTRISMHMGLQCRNCLHIWFPVYDPSASRFSPGRLLLKSLIDNCTEHGITLLDDGEATDDQMQKRLMGNSRHNYLRGSWQNPGISSFLARADYSLRWRLQKLKQTKN